MIAIFYLTLQILKLYLNNIHPLPYLLLKHAHILFVKIGKNMIKKLFSLFTLIKILFSLLQSVIPTNHEDLKYHRNNIWLKSKFNYINYIKNRFDSTTISDFNIYTYY